MLEIVFLQTGDFLTELNSSSCACRNLFAPLNSYPLKQETFESASLSLVSEALYPDTQVKFTHSRAYIDTFVSYMSALRITEHAKKKAQDLSGGTKRKVVSYHTFSFEFL